MSDKSDVVPFLENSLSVYNDMISEGIDKPLVDLPVYAGTDKDYTYYCKGALFAFYLNLKMYDQKIVTLNDFMQHLYSKYNITDHPVESWQLISTADLLQELNDFTGINFNQDFDDCVYGTEKIPLSSITLSDVEPLIITNEDITLITILNTNTEELALQNYAIFVLPILILSRLFFKKKKK